MPGAVQKCYHAMALDERRGNFEPTRVKSPRGGPSTEGRLEEVWFRGVHSDVGGGQSIGLSSITLCWMIKRALSDGLPIDEVELGRFEALRNPDASISENFDPKKDPARKIKPTDLVHETVRARGNAGGMEHNDPPSGLKVVRD